jgi:hypothetical protein
VRHGTSNDTERDVECHGLYGDTRHACGTRDRHALYVAYGSCRALMQLYTAPTLLHRAYSPTPRLLCYTAPTLLHRPTARANWLVSYCLKPSSMRLKPSSMRYGAWQRYGHCACATSNDTELEKRLDTAAAATRA